MSSACANLLKVCYFCSGIYTEIDSMFYKFLGIRVSECYGTGYCNQSALDSTFLGSFEAAPLTSWMDSPEISLFPGVLCSTYSVTLGPVVATTDVLGEAITAS